MSSKPSARGRRLPTLRGPATANDAPADRHFRRAALLDGAGRTAEARAAYLEALRADPLHPGALNELGRLLDRTGFPVAARTAYAQAVAAHPLDPVGHGNLANSLLDGGELAQAREQYEIAVRLDPANSAAHACLAVLLLRMGDRRAAREHARIAFRTGATAWPYRGAGEPIPVLVVLSALGGNVAFERYLDDRIFAKYTIVAEFDDPALPLPLHRLAVNAIGDADRCGAALTAARDILARSAAPVINAPAQVLATGRAANAARLAELAGVRAPRIARRSRAQLRAGAGALAAAGLRLPAIVRAPGFHTGQHCLLVTTPAELDDALATLPGDDLLAIEYIDVRGSDGRFRKYRVMIVEGRIFPLHLAVSAHWKVHYFSADMACADHRAEEAAFLHDMHGALGARAVAALETIAQRLALAYGGIDFALDAQGRVVVFEANATMIVAPPGPDACWEYRREPVARIEAAVGAMLRVRAGAASSVSIQS